MTLNDLQGHSRIEGIQSDFWYSCSADNKISTDTERRAVPLRQLSLLSKVLDSLSFITLQHIKYLFIIFIRLGQDATRKSFIGLQFAAI